MLVNAGFHKEKLIEWWEENKDTGYLDHLKIFNNRNVFEEINPDKRKNRMQLVEVIDDEIIAYFEAFIDLKNLKVTELLTINISKKRELSQRSFYNVIKKIFDMNFVKIRVSTIEGSRSQMTMETAVRLIAFRYVGLFINEIKDEHGNFYNVKVYELLKEDFENCKFKKRMERVCERSRY